MQADPKQSTLTLGLNTSIISLGEEIRAGIGGMVVGSIDFAALGYVEAGIALTAFVAAIVVKARKRTFHLPHQRPAASHVVLI